MALRVYLDSSDFSVLSDPGKESVELAAIRERLAGWARSGEVDFRYSAAHIIEMSPLRAEHTEAAERRAELLFQLCGTKTLISFDLLLQKELEAMGGSGSVVPFSDNGEWFPELTDLMSPVSWADNIKSIGVQLKELGANRALRRQQMRAHFKDGKPRAKTLDTLSEQQSAGLKEMMKLYPMRPADAKVLSDYVLGRASAAEADEAFLSSLRDPRWMIRWFHNHSEALSPVIDWLRAPSQNVCATLSNATEAALNFRKVWERVGDTSGVPPGLDARAKLEMQASILNRIARQFSKASDNETDNDLDTFARYAPGITVCIKSLVTSAWNSFAMKPRVPKPSDFVDTIHAMYSPYVDVFRTDSYMAPIIASNLNKKGATVVGKLKDVIGVIDTKLRAA
ncbi:hypothetical protein [Noviherbaspirillum sp. UKPF54]|uniref:hypothetical protein n=1 Tax=Noviherbaspirillum sp. UKPF54 TaxID=2601898 RepID=UPI0011B18941|nr:hypothetical protein [Noviherbaspirillum sp. UKPF54]QDZ28698.1 hypothetical protein FAY22_12500 [Noviherbaspirillum sp. UKPF54]